jgi:hypothetical protein
MEKKAIIVEIDDLREVVGGADVKVAAATQATMNPAAGLGHAAASPSVNGTAMCWYGWFSPDSVEDWVVIKGK